MFMEPEKPKSGLSPPPGAEEGRAVCSVTWGTLPIILPSPRSHRLVEERGDWTSWRLTVMSKGQDHKARGLAPPQ